MHTSVAFLNLGYVVLIVLFSLQINIYAKYTDASNLIKEDNLATAVCSSDLQSFSLSFGITYITLCIAVFVPIGVIIVLFITFRNLQKRIVNFIIRPSQQAGLVAYTVIGVYVSFSIFVLDILACKVVSTSDHEFAGDIDQTSIALQITYVTLFFDSLPFLSLIVCISCIFYHSIKIFLGIQNRQSIYIHKAISLVVGNKNVINFNNISDSNIIAVIFPFMLIPPIISLSSHVGYIFLAWITDPSKASAILILVYAILLCLFYSFKYIYISYSSLNFSVMEPNRVTETGEEIGNSDRLEFQDIQEDISQGDKSQHTTEPGRGEGDGQLHTTKLCRLCYVSPIITKQINTQAFCLVLFHSVFIMGFLIIIITMLILIPFAAEEFTSYVVNILQLLVLIISTQFSLRVFFNEKFDVVEFIATLKEALVKNKETNSNIKSVTGTQDKNVPVKVAGVIAAELTSAILQK